MVVCFWCFLTAVEEFTPDKAWRFPHTDDWLTGYADCASLQGEPQMWSCDRPAPRRERGEAQEEMKGWDQIKGSKAVPPSLGSLGRRQGYSW